MTQWGLDVLFNPAKRHMDEEKQRLQSTREEVGDASKGNRIDLSSGKVTIRRRPAEDGEDQTDEDQTDEDQTDEDQTDEDQTDEPDEAESAVDEAPIDKADPADPAESPSKRA